MGPLTATFWDAAFASGLQATTRRMPGGTLSIRNVPSACTLV